MRLGFLAARILGRASLQRIGASCDDGVVAVGRVVGSMEQGSTIRLGARTALVSSSQYTALGVSHPVVLRTLSADARIEIGADSGLSGATLVARSLVELGEGCLIGADALVIDTDFHPVHTSERRYAPVPVSGPSDAVVLGRNVFVGARAIILRGSRIGDNSVVAAGAVVRGVFPQDVIIAGNPATIVGSVRRSG